MNYRHVYHAGNFADVVKHATLAHIVTYLQRKETPLMILDAHAGPGLYDLSCEQASKTNEWQGGIGKIWEGSGHPALQPWLDVVRAFNPDGELAVYPGSPKLFQAMLRPQDRLVLVEKHPQDHVSADIEFGRDPRVRIHLDDAYARIKACLPPPERRGLVLIDPPYEEKDEHRKLVKGLAQALKRWPSGIYCIWYPIKGRAQIDSFWDDLKSLAPPPTLAAELMIRPGDDPFRLNGCGLLILNPPWTLEESLKDMLPYLLRTLAPGKGSYRLEWLAREPA